MHVTEEAMPNLHHIHLDAASSPPMNLYTVNPSGHRLSFCPVCVTETWPNQGLWVLPQYKYSARGKAFQCSSLEGVEGLVKKQSLF